MLQDCQAVSRWPANRQEPEQARFAFAASGHNGRPCQSREGCCAGFAQACAFHHYHNVKAEMRKKQTGNACAERCEEGGRLSGRLPHEPRRIFTKVAHIAHAFLISADIAGVFAVDHIPVGGTGQDHFFISIKCCMPSTAVKPPARRPRQPRLLAEASPDLSRRPRLPAPKKPS